ncbi:MAG: ATP-binding protein [Methanobrevibacter sp.]|uniref:ATP-binding protein n=1 Tax=Methanobrevibacter sp. TaxID=66852 RepID=UPI0025D99174|nr:AAA family ATPase [Methanobrevibacter sp.]MBQ6098327.1 ATP-binding protein [Methanobrevibacter sp.]
MNTTLNTYIQNQITVKPTVLDDEISYAGKRFNHRQDFDKITSYIDDFLEGKNINRFLLLPGIRDVGKSTILFQTYEYLLRQKNISPRNILYMSGDHLKQMCNATIMDGILSYTNQYHAKPPELITEPVFLLIDEAQYDPNWALTGKVIFDSAKNIFMIFSGSSALELTYNGDAARRLLSFPITPLNYPEHLRLKYGDFKNDISKQITDLIFNQKTPDTTEIYSKIARIYADFGNFDLNEWDNFLKFGGFTSGFFQTKAEICKKIIDIVNRVITTDMKNIEGLNGTTQDLAFQLLYFFALQNPGEISKGSMANHLDSNKPTVNKILDTLEKTQLIFHVSPFTSSAKRTTKPNKYYFATSSLKHVLSLNLGNATLENPNAYMGKLLENFVASSFFNLENKSDILYRTYYDGGKKGAKNVDFVVQRGMDNPIPVEVSYGKKDKSQIRRAIKKYDSPNGIIISNTTENIVKEDDIIYLPPQIFSFL